MRRILPIALGLALTAGLLVGPALAGKPPHAIAGMVQVYNYVNHFGPSPEWCMGEDDQLIQRFAGSLLAGATSTATVQFCDRAVDGFSPGGTGLMVWLDGKADLAIRMPSGEQEQDRIGNWPDPPYPYPEVPGLLVSRGVQAACVVPGYHISTNVGFGTIDGGIYTVTIRNPTSHTIRNLLLSVTVLMAVPNIQMGACPEPYQNLEP